MSYLQMSGCDHLDKLDINMHVKLAVIESFPLCDLTAPTRSRLRCPRAYFLMRYWVVSFCVQRLFVACNVTSLLQSLWLKV